MSEDAHELADPTQRPEADVVIWDGKCNFCRQQVTRLNAFDWGHRLAFLSLHDSRVAELCPELTYEQLMDQMWVVTSEGHRFGGADAARYLSRKLPTLWWLMPLLHIPGTMPLWRWLYKKVAQRRYKLAGVHCDENGTCELHQ